MDLYNHMEERAVLSAIFSQPECFAEIHGVLSASDFHSPVYAAIFQAMETAAAGGREIDLVSIADILQRADRKSWGDLSITAAVTEIAQSWTPAAGTMQHVQTVKDYANRRLMVDVARAINEQAHSEGDTREKIVACQDVLAAALGSENSQESPAEQIDNYLLWLKQQPPDGIITGFPALDKLVYLSPGVVFVIAGATGLGKSVLCETIAINVAKQGKSVALFSLEMPAVLILSRAYSRLANIGQEAIMRKELTQEELARVERVAHRLDTLHIVDGGGKTVADIKSRSFAIQAQSGLDLLIVDYVQLLRGSKNYGTRASELDSICADLKTMAVRLNVPVILAAQINRNVDAKQDKRPELSDIRDSAGIVLSADCVGMIYRAGYYSHDSSDRSATLFIRKNRSGETGKVAMEFYGERCTFTNPRKERTEANEKDSGY